MQHALLKGVIPRRVAAMAPVPPVGEGLACKLTEAPSTPHRAHQLVRWARDSNELSMPTTADTPSRPSSRPREVGFGRRHTNNTFELIRLSAWGGSVWVSVAFGFVPRRATTGTLSVKTGLVSQPLLSVSSAPAPPPSSLPPITVNLVNLYDVTSTITIDL